MKNFKEKLLRNLKWIKNECKDWKTLGILMCVIAIIYSPVWVGYILYFIFRWNWCLVMATLTATFWFGPFTPFFPICIAITFAIKKLMQVKEKN